jgi:hypothetical protein
MKYIRDRQARQMRAIKTKVIVYVNIEGLPACSTICTGLLNMCTRSTRTSLLPGGKRDYGLTVFDQWTCNLWSGFMCLWLFIVPHGVLFCDKGATVKIFFFRIFTCFSYPLSLYRCSTRRPYQPDNQVQLKCPKGQPHTILLCVGLLVYQG